MARRTRGEGTLYKTETGRWRAQIVIQGRRLSHTTKTAREGREWIRRQLEKPDQGINLERAHAPLNDYLDDWLANVKTSRASSTYCNYRDYIKRYIRPVLGEVKMSDLRPDLIQSAIDGMLKNGLPVYSTGYAFKLLKMSLKRAVKLRILGYNPAEGVTPPKAPKKEMQVWDENQVQIYLLTIDADQPRSGALLKLAVGTGMRLGELLGLMWGDVDWERKQISIHRQPKLVRETKNDFGPLKSKSSERTIRLANILMDALREHRERQFVEMKVFESDWNDIDLVFPNERGNAMLRCSATKIHKTMLKRAELPYIRFHDLRHTAVSLMLQNGVPIVEVSKYIGHARVSITLDTYGHLAPSWHSQAAEKMDEILTHQTFSF